MTAIQRVITAAFAVCTLAVTANAAVAGEFTVGYSLAAGAVSDPIVPPPNIPVQLTGVLTNAGFRGVGQVALLRVPANFIEWVGLDSTAGAALTQGFSGAAGTKIVFIDFAHTVIVEVASTDSIQVHNTNGVPAAGSVTLTW